MLIPYKKEYEKIAMGLLSFMPGKKSIKIIREWIDLYQTSKTSQLYLWKNDTDRFIGVIGIKESGRRVYVNNITVDPSHRNEGHGTTMVKTLIVMNSLPVVGSERTKHFVDKCKVSS
ncbi:GNAT family N-acetyltransferase [Salipaludibacillus keqinensis]|uniref:GNAT family N-acetyltransferase n=1 Tax=Salipaludibacillus keqinensis TaxID=2045207 RepID=A0A323TL39_9BACI|nr:GNAT family N-acetyltransferase [Salipaludibacillus keqinensis]PYZ94447.1 GNAT family N-acetyltransferase [Salipaludibacillus keqinensis]